MTAPAAVPDDAWAALARSSRLALSALGYVVDVQCLPDEIVPCGATFAQHAAAHIATLRAVIDHHAGHLGHEFDPMMTEIYGHAKTEFDDPEFCQRMERRQV